MTQIQTIISPFIAQAPAASSGAPGGGLGGMLVPMLLMLGLMYFLIIRPQHKRQKETANMQNSLNEGDEVITVSGVYGTIVSVQEKTVGLRIADNVKIKLERTGIASKVNLANAEKKA
jgi:preprotein translocase subunit YajC